MPYKDKQKQKEAQRKYYLNNRGKYAKSTKDRRLRNKRLVDDIKAELVCAECGEHEICCLDFHHSNPNVKVTTVSKAIREFGKKKLLLEVEKCLVVCANCHAKLHFSPIVSGESWCGFNRARIKKRLWFIDYISHAFCVGCGESDSRCLDHHHTKPKRFNISYLLTSGHSIDYLQSEIERCIVVCKNCHRKIHLGC